MLGLIFATILALVIAIFSILFITLEYYVGIIGYIKGAPFVPSKPDRIKTMIELADLKDGMHVVDLGSGDGSIVIAAAQKGTYAAGIEMNPFLIPYSRWRAKRAHVTDRTTFIRGELDTYPLHDIDVVFVYLLTPLLAIIKPKLISELKPGSKIISNAFQIQGLTPHHQEDGVFVYLIS